MKHTKLWSCLLAALLLVSCAVGIFAVGADAENTVIYYTLGEVEKEGAQNFDTLSEALAALKAKDKKWGANESVEIQFKGDISGGAQDGILFGLTTVWRENGTKLPITFRGVDTYTSRDAYIYLDAAGGWYACANDYTFANLTLPVGDQNTKFYAGSGNVRFENVLFMQSQIKIKTAAEQAIEHQFMHDIARVVAGRNNADVLPAGDAWFDLIQNNPDVGDNLSRSLKQNRPEGDYKHDGDIGGGMYLNACIWYEVLTKKSCVGHTWRPSEGYCDYTLDEALVPVLQEAAHKAVVAEYGADYYDDDYNPDLNGDNELNILNIGSSNGYYYVDELCQMLTADGFTARVCTAYHSGVYISEQWTWAAGTAAGDYQFRIYEADSDTTSGIVAAEAKSVGFDHFETKYAWDSITFYQTSGGFIYQDVGTDTQTKYNAALNACAKADNLYAYMRKTNPNARYTWYQVACNPIGYPGPSTTPKTTSGYFFGDTCTDAVFSGWPALSAGEKVETSLTFGPGTSFYSADVKNHVAAVGYLYDPARAAFTDATAKEFRYPASLDYPNIADIRPGDVSASIILDGGKLYDVLAKYGASPSDGTVHMKSGTANTLSGDTRTNSTVSKVENYYGDMTVKVSGGTVEGGVFGMYDANTRGNLIIDVSEDDGTTKIGTCLRGLFSSGEVTGNIEMTVRGGTIGPDSANNSFYGGGNAKGEVINTISGGTLVGRYFGLRCGNPSKITNKFLGGKIIGNGTALGNVFGGHYENNRQIGDIVNIIDGTQIEGFFAGGSQGHTATCGTITNTFKSGSVAQYFGSHYQKDSTAGMVTNRFEGGTVQKYARAGGYSATNQKVLTGTAVVNGKTVTASFVNYLSGTKFVGEDLDGTVYAYFGSGFGTECGDVYNLVSGGTFGGLWQGTGGSTGANGKVTNIITGSPVFEKEFCGAHKDKTPQDVVTTVSGTPVFKSVFYGAGASAANKVQTTINGGTFKNAAYLSGVNLKGRVSTVEINGGTFEKETYCGANKGTAEQISVTVNGGSFKGIFYGGNYNGDVTVNVEKIDLTIAGGDFANAVFGANRGFTVGDVHVIVKGNPTFGGNFAPGSWNKTSGTVDGVELTASDTKTGNVTLEISGGTFAKYKRGTENNKEPEGIGIYAGSASGTVGNIKTTVTGGTFNGYFFAGYGGTMGTLTTEVRGGKFKNTAYFGPWAGSTSGDISNTILGGTFSANTFLGGAGATGDITNVIGDAKGGPVFDTSSTTLYCGNNRDKKAVGNIHSTFNNGSFKAVMCGNAYSTSSTKNVTTVFNGGTYTNSISGSGYGTCNGKVTLVIHGGTFNEYVMAAGRSNVVLPQGSTETYDVEMTIYGGTFKGVWSGGEGSSLTFTGNIKTTIYGGIFNHYNSSSSRLLAFAAGGRGMKLVGHSEAEIYGGTFNGEIVAGAQPNGADSYNHDDPDGTATVNIYGGTFNKPILANTKWKNSFKWGKVVLNPKESDIIINSTMLKRAEQPGVQEFEIIGAEHKIILGADAEIEATKVSGNVKFGQGAAWAKKVYATLPEGNTAKVTVSGAHTLDKIGDSVVAVKGGIQLYGATMILTDRVAVRALFDKASVEGLGNFSFTFKMGEETLAEGTKADLEPYGDAYYGIVLAKIGAKDFTKSVALSGDLVWEKEFSVKGLAILAETAWAGNEKGVALAKAMQNFATIVADPAANLPHTLTPDMSPVEGFIPSGKISTETAFKVRGKGLVMSNAVGIRIYGASDVDVTNDYFTIKVNGTDVTDKAVITAGENNAYTVDLYVNAKNMSSELKIELIEKASGKTCLELVDRVDAIAASYPATHEKYDLVQQLLVYIQAAVSYAKA